MPFGFCNARLLHPLAIGACWPWRRQTWATAKGGAGAGLLHAAQVRPPDVELEESPVPSCSWRDPVLRQDYSWRDPAPDPDPSPAPSVSAPPPPPPTQPTQSSNAPPPNPTHTPTHPPSRRLHSRGASRVRASIWDATPRRTGPG